MSDDESLGLPEPAESTTVAADDAVSETAPSDPERVGTSTANATIKLPPRTEGGRERTIHIVGTAHVSKASVEEVRRVIHEVKPDTVCVELDQMRYEALTDPARWRKLDIFQVIRQGKVLFLMASLALQAFQKRLGDKLGVQPGAELLAGVEAAKELGAEVVLVDRDVQITLKRTWANLRFWHKLDLIGKLGASMFVEGDEITEEQIEALKDREQIGDAMSEFAKAVPRVKVPLIDERDQYLMSSIEEAPGDVVVAVVGAGHVDGMTKQVGKAIDRDALSKIPSPSYFVRALKWVIPVVILAAFGWGYYKHQGEGLQQMLFAWVLPNAVVAALFTLVAGGRILSVLTALVASPITSLNPTIAAGMFVGLVEAWLRRPTVEDCERLGKEVTTWDGMKKNPFSRILIIAIAANLGSMLGAYAGATWVLTLL